MIQTIVWLVLVAAILGFCVHVFVYSGRMIRRADQVIADIDNRRAGLRKGIDRL